MLTYSFPCQDLSVAGKGKGMSKGSGTRSGMLWEVERILSECGEELPQILIMENVPQVVGTKNKNDFDDWTRFLESKGYTNKWSMLNAKDVGYPEPLPQNRKRCFMVSVLNPKNDITFPKETDRTIKLKDILEQNVDSSYYLTGNNIECIKKWNAYQKPLETLERIEKNEYSPTLTTRSCAYAAGMVLVKQEYRGMFQYAKSDSFMGNRDRFTPNKEIADCLQTTQKEGCVFVESTVVDKFIDELLEEL